MTLRRCVFVLLGFMLLCAGAHAESQVTEPDSTRGEHKIIAFYFYFSPRCETCLNMEVYSKQAVQKGFAAEVKKGQVEWQSLDIEEAEHKHFWNDYNLETKSLVIVDILNGKQVRWKNCQQIWDLAEDKRAFQDYVIAEIKAYLMPE